MRVRNSHAQTIASRFQYLAVPGGPRGPSQAGLRLLRRGRRTARLRPDRPARRLPRGRLGRTGRPDDQGRPGGPSPPASAPLPRPAIVRGVAGLPQGLRRLHHALGPERGDPGDQSHQDVGIYGGGEADRLDGGPRRGPRPRRPRLSWPTMPPTSPAWFAEAPGRFEAQRPHARCPSSAIEPAIASWDATAGRGMREAHRPGDRRPTLTDLQDADPRRPRFRASSSHANDARNLDRRWRPRRPERRALPGRRRLSSSLTRTTGPAVSADRSSTGGSPSTTPGTSSSPPTNMVDALFRDGSQAENFHEQHRESWVYLYDDLPALPVSGEPVRSPARRSSRSACLA